MKRQNRVKVGLFVTLSFFMLTGAIGWLAGSRFFRAVDTYEIRFAKSVSGLLPGSRVEYQGVTVGRVKRLSLTSEPPPEVVVTVELKPLTPVRHDTYAVLRGSLVTNIRYIELGGGTKDSPPMEDGETIGVKDGDSLEDITGRAGQASEVALAIMKRLQSDVLTDKNIAAISTMMSNLAAMSTDLRNTVAQVATPTTAAALNAMVADMQKAAAGLRRTSATIEGLRGDATVMIGDAKLTVAEAKAALAELNKAVVVTQQVLGQIGALTGHVDSILYQNQGDLGRALGGLAGTMRELNQTLTTIRYDPARLVWGSHLPDRKVPDK